MNEVGKSWHIVRDHYHLETLTGVRGILFKRTLFVLCCLPVISQKTVRGRHPIFFSVFNWSFLKFLYAFFLFQSSETEWDHPSLEEIAIAFCPCLSPACKRKHWSQIEKQNSWEMAALACDSEEVKAILLCATGFLYDLGKLRVSQCRRKKTGPFLPGRRSSQYLRLWMSDVCYKITKAQQIQFILSCGFCNRITQNTVFDPNWSAWMGYCHLCTSLVSLMFQNILN